MTKRNMWILLLAALLLTTSCGTTAEETLAAETAAQTEEAIVEPETKDVFADYRNIDLGGRTINISVSNNVSEGGGGMPTSYPYIAGPDELTGESVQDNVYNRNLEVSEMLNCVLVHTALDLDYDKVQNHVEKLVKSGDTSIDYYINDQLGLNNTALNGYMLNVANESNFTKSYFDFTVDAYYGEYMANTAIGDKRFLITGDYFIDTLRAAQVLYWNKNMAADKFGNGDYLYEVVLEGAWTHDKLNEVVEAAYQDLDGDGQASDGDIYGFVGNVTSGPGPYNLFVFATDCQVVTKDADGIPYIREDRMEKLDHMAEQLTRLHYGVGLKKMATPAESVDFFVAEKSFISYFSKIGDMENAALRDFEGWGLVPYPKVDETQANYMTIVHDTAELGALPSTTVGEAASAVSAVIQTLSVHAHEYLLNDYYEVALKSKYAQDTYISQMLDIVVAGIVSPFEYMYTRDISFVPVESSVSAQSNVTASTFQKNLPKVQDKLDKLIQTFADLP